MAIPGLEKPDILQVVQSAGIELRQRGARFWGICPFHAEKTPSFSVNPEKQRWRCFGSCGTGGDVFDFIMKIKGIPFREAMDLLRMPGGLAREPQPGQNRPSKGAEASIVRGVQRVVRFRYPGFGWRGLVVQHNRFTR